MNSRERTFLTLNFEQPDRVPIDFWMSEGFKTKLEAGLNMSVKEFLDLHDVDLRYIEGPKYIGPQLRKFPDGTEEDIWGVRRKIVTIRIGTVKETYKEVAGSPLSSVTGVEEVNNYARWPSPDWFDYGSIEKQCENIQKQGRVAVFMGDRLNRIAQLKPAMYLRGVEQIFMDMSLTPDIANAIFFNIRKFYCEYIERILTAAKGKLDILLMGDDFGSQNGPLISPEMWINFLGDGFGEYINISKKYNIRVMHHTCGSVKPIIPFMIERGLDILQSIQPEASDMDPRNLKTEFGRKLAFHGGISVQRTLPFCTPADIHNEVRARIDALAGGGGYILCTSHNIQADTPLENVKELFNAYMKYGRYS